MPCYDSRSDDEAKTMRKRLDAATRAACDMARVMVEMNMQLWRLSSETQSWIEDHNRMDAARRRAKAADSNG